MDNFSLAFDAGSRVFVAAVLLGAGLPAMFALATRVLAGPGVSELRQAGPARIGVAGLLYGLVMIFVLLGLTYIVISGQGKTFEFNGILPSIVDK